MTALQKLLAVPAAERVAVHIDSAGSGRASDEIRHRDPQMHYFILDVAGLPGAEADGWRLVLAEQGYSPVTGPHAPPGRPESVVNRPQAELWGMPLASWKAVTKARREVARKSPLFARANAGRSYYDDPYRRED